MEIGQFPQQLEDLIEQPSGRASQFWDGPYLAKKVIPLDGWNNELEYNAPPTRFASEGYKYYEIISLGEDGIESNDDLHVGD